MSKSKPTVTSTDDVVKPVSIGLGEGSIDLSVEESVHLSTLHQHPGWPILMSILKGMRESATYALLNRSASLEDLRFEQGRAAVAGHIADLVQQEMPAWYKKGAAERSGADHADTPPNS